MMMVVVGMLLLLVLLQAGLLHFAAQTLDCQGEGRPGWVDLKTPGADDPGLARQHFLPLAAAAAAALAPAAAEVVPLVRCPKVPWPVGQAGPYC
jgi:hypothetical protein